MRESKGERRRRESGEDEVTRERETGRTALITTERERDKIVITLRSGSYGSTQDGALPNYKSRGMGSGDGTGWRLCMKQRCKEQGET